MHLYDTIFQQPTHTADVQCGVCCRSSCSCHALSPTDGPLAKPRNQKAQLVGSYLLKYWDSRSTNFSWSLTCRTRRFWSTLVAPSRAAVSFFCCSCKFFRNVSVEFSPFLFFVGGVVAVVRWVLALGCQSEAALYLPVPLTMLCHLIPCWKLSGMDK